MMPSRFRKRMLAFAGMLIAGWLLQLLAGHRIAAVLSRMLGSKLAAITDGKVASPEIFIHGRAEDLLWVATAAFLLVLLVIGLDCLAGRLRWYCAARGIYLGLLSFVILNALVYIAERTALFWIPFYPGYVDNYAQFQIKRRLLPEAPSLRPVLLLGNSQLNSNLDEKEMNLRLKQKVWATELHQSGIVGLDFRFIVDEIQDVPAYCAVTYVAPNTFASLPNGQAATRFIAFRDLADLLKNGGWNSFPAGALRTGLIGRVIPLFHHNASFSQRILGAKLVKLEQARFDESLETNLDVQAERRAWDLKVTPQSEAQRRGFEEAIEHLAARCEHVVIVAGVMHPKLEELRPELRVAMNDILASLQKRYPNIIIVPQDDLLSVNAGDFADLVHFNKDAQHRFTDKFSDWLAERLAIGQ